MDDASVLQEAPHRRFNPLTREWVLVSPHRTKRPWLGRVEKQGGADLPAYDPNCYLCPGNERADGARNPKYSSTFAFDNDFAALLPDGPHFEIDEGGLLVARAERGICRVICFSPRHDLTIPRMTPKQIGEVIGVWAAEFRRLGEIDWVRHVQIFENRGALMGASNPHPHCQIWASASVPYSMGFHQRPTDGRAYPEWHFHAHYFPPLLRSATVQKFMVGYELLGNPQRDITAENAARRLKELSEILYLDRV